MDHPIRAPRSNFRSPSARATPGINCDRLSRQSTVQAGASALIDRSNHSQEFFGKRERAVTSTDHSHDGEELVGQGYGVSARANAELS